MRRVVLLAALLALMWTSVAAAQAPGDLPEGQPVRLKAFMDYLYGLQRTTDKNLITSLNGYDWVLTASAAKGAYVQGFMTAAYLLGDYGASVVMSCLGLDNANSSVATWTLDALLGLLKASDFRFRVGVYVLELDVFYSDYANRDIPVMEAMYIVNERLNGREVNLEEWRKKGQQS